MTDHSTTYALEIQSLTDAKLAEELYSCRQDIQNLPKCSWISEMSKQALEWTKKKVPMLEAEVARRGMTLPHWV